MHNTLAQKWVSDLAAQDERARTESELDAAESIAASRLVDAEIPEFMRQFLRELSTYTETLRTIQIRCNVSDFSDEHETRCRVEVALAEALSPRFTHTNIFHSIGAHTVRCLTLGGNAFKLHFSTYPKGNTIGLVSDTILSVMDAEKAAKFIVEPMVDWLRSRKREIY